MRIMIHIGPTLGALFLRRARPGPGPHKNGDAGGHSEPYTATFRGTTEWSCEDRIGTDPSWARTEVIYIDLGDAGGRLKPYSPTFRGTTERCSNTPRRERRYSTGAERGQTDLFCVINHAAAANMSRN